MPGQKPSAIDEKTRVSVPMKMLAGLVVMIIVAAFSFLAGETRGNRDGVDANADRIAELQESINLTLAEMKHNRERIDDHCDSDHVRTAAEVRDAMRGID